MRMFISTLILILSTCASADAALYEFTLRGFVTFAAAGDVPPGSPVTIRYIADSKDLAPSSLGGHYAASNATIQFPTFTLTMSGLDPYFRVALGAGNTVDLLGYSTVDGFWDLTVPFSFPPGTLETDALPLSLPLEIATCQVSTCSGS